VQWFGRGSGGDSVTKANGQISGSIALSTSDKVLVGVIYSAIGLATVMGFVVSSIVGRMSILLAGLGIVAFVFGLRHGVDADHIAAIDNTTRKLMHEKGAPFTVGLWFSLGHSTIVVGLIIGLVIATRAIVGHIPLLQQTGVIIGTTISGVFLWLIGLVNLAIVFSIYGIFKEMKIGRLEQSELEALLDNRGFLNRFFRPLFKIVKRPWQMFPIGVLFGLGFDTATEVALIATSVGVGVSSSIPIWMILVLPFMFTCGMVLVDTSDGLAMRLAYGWAFLNPIRKIYYNLTVTVISVLVALVIGSVELLQVFAFEYNLTGVFWSWIVGLDFETLGFGVVLIFVLSWVISVVAWKRGWVDRSALSVRT
jgi:high-affinity nickel-transport protein